MSDTRQTPDPAGSAADAPGPQGLDAVSPELDAIFAMASPPAHARRAPLVNRHVRAFRAAEPRPRARLPLSQLSLLAAGLVGLAVGVAVAPQVRRPLPPQMAPAVAVPTPVAISPATAPIAPPPTPTPAALPQPAAAEPVEAEATPVAEPAPRPAHRQARHAAAHPRPRPFPQRTLLRVVRFHPRPAPHPRAPAPHRSWSRAWAATAALNRSGYPYASSRRAYRGQRYDDPPPFDGPPSYERPSYERPPPYYGPDEE